MQIEHLQKAVRDVPDFPKPGIVFKDITPILQDPGLFRSAVDQMVAPAREMKVDKIVAIESRGFLFGAPMAYELNAGMVLVRKPKKLPYKTARIDYELEYGTDSLEMHVDAINPGDRVLIVDDVLATGGTAKATGQLVEQTGGKLVGFSFFMELEFLKGRDRITDYFVHSLLKS